MTLSTLRHATLPPTLNPNPRPLPPLLCPLVDHVALDAARFSTQREAHQAARLQDLGGQR